MQTLVSLISDQAIPNLLFIKEFSGEIGSYVFITTPLMQSRLKTQHLMDAAALKPNMCREVVVENENDLEAIHQVLSKEFTGLSYLVNLTGGTKMMFLAAYNFFRKTGNSLYYLPIAKNTVTELYPGNQITEVSSRLTVKEYLQAYGISYNAESPEKIEDFALLKQILKDYRRVGYDINALQNNFSDSKQFFTGDWFEQFVYHLIKQKYRLTNGFIETRLKINNFAEQHRSGNDNELDVVFSLNNELHVIEAKVSLGIKKINPATLDKALFKLSALNKNFGLRSHPWLFTLSDLENETDNFKSDLNRKLKVLGIKEIIDRNKIISKSFNIL